MKEGRPNISQSTSLVAIARALGHQIERHSELSPSVQCASLYSVIDLKSVFIIADICRELVCPLESWTSTTMFASVLHNNFYSHTKLSSECVFFCTTWITLSIILHNAKKKGCPAFVTYVTAGFPMVDEAGGAGEDSHQLSLLHY